MTGDRNAPCFCGSGLKYKRCHGSGEHRSIPTTVLEQNREQAYLGALGRSREAFCREYTLFKQTAVRRVEEDLRQETANAGLAISCRKGCGVCCSCYIIATLQECESIVYYLYHHDDVRRQFLTAYPGWQKRVRADLAVFEKARKLQAELMSHPYSETEHLETVAALDEYMALKLPCPFLTDGACSIYPVRPYVCAGVVATTPPEWCDPTFPGHGNVNLCKADVFFDQDMPYFLPMEQKLIYACMPMLVGGLLQRGWATLATMPGLAALERSWRGDPDVQAYLSQRVEKKPKGQI